MRRRLTAVTLVLGLLAAPGTAASAEEPPVTELSTEGEAAPGPLTTLADLLAQLAQALVDGRDATSGDDVDEDTTAAFEEFVASLETLLADLFADVYFSAVAEEALADAEEGLEEPSDGTTGEAVSTVARCAPRGGFGDLVEGMAHHGEYVTAAAHGETVALTVPTIAADEATGAPGVVTEAGEPVEFDLSTVEGAEALCDALGVVYQARLLQLDVAWEEVDTTRDARRLAREQCRLERLRARNDDGAGDAKEACAELRARVRDQHREERDARRADRDARRAERDAERATRAADRAERKAERTSGKGDRRDR